MAADKNADFECEAHFYIGEWYVLDRKYDYAERELTQAGKTCRHEFIEYLGAEAELKRLPAKGQTPR
jgi:hypothetical protein